MDDVKIKKFFIQTMGCPKNEVDSDFIAYSLIEKGYEKADDFRNADIIIVNTCSFIDDAKEESIEAVLEFANAKNNDIKLVLAGCMAEQFGQELLDEIPEVDAVIGNRNLLQATDRIDKILSNRNERITQTGGDYDYWYKDSSIQIPDTYPYAYIKIAEGCDNHCSYCTIPQIRGKYRSLPRNMILHQATGLVQNGFKELILIAQDTTDYGKDLYGDHYKLADLIADLNRISGDFYIRLMYTNPSKIEQDLIDAIKLERVIKYLDMPVQHVSDRMLKAMNRNTTFSQIESVIESLKSQIPGIALRTTLLTGYPGETEADFQKLVELVESNQFLHLGAFSYSPQENTIAGKISENFDYDKAREHKEILEFLQVENYYENNKKLIGNVIKVIIDSETVRDGFYLGRTLYDAPEIDREVKLQGKAEPGDIVDGLILRTFEYKILGTII
ncbi:MAG: 30S ribosomal protein S12 methylthiotransferase RimO [Candidatus Zixiibacteriota bacterium]